MEFGKRNVIRYDENDYVYYICDLDGLVISYEKRVKQGKKCLWDYDIDINRIRGDIFSIPKDGRYRLPTGLAEDLQSELKRLQKELKRIRNEQKEIENELKNLKIRNLDQLQHNIQKREELLFNISRSLAKKIVYGY